MLVFVVPLQNPETSRDWQRCNALCQQTIRSALNQTHGDIHVIVVCKDFAPGIIDPRLTVIRRPFPAPGNTWEDRDRDKRSKLTVGLIEAGKYAPCYVMKLDADDLLSRDLSSIVHELNHPSGYYIERGYSWEDGARFVRAMRGFHLVCGSSSIVRCAARELPSSEEEDMSRFPILRLGHHLTVDGYAQLGRPLTAITSPAVIYRVGHGENLSRQLFPAGTTHTAPNWKFYVGQALETRKLRPLTPALKRAFFG